MEPGGGGDRKQRSVSPLPPSTASAVSMLHAEVDFSLANLLNRLKKLLKKKKCLIFPASLAMRGGYGTQLWPRR